MPETAIRATSQGNQHGGHQIPPKKTTQRLAQVSYLKTLKATVVEQFRDTPYRLTRVEAERCARAVMKVVERSPRHTF